MWSVSDANKWNPFWVYGSEMAGNYLSDTINDKWVTCNTTVPIFSPLLIGNITVELYDEFSTTFTDPILPAAESFFSGTISKSSSFIDPGTTFTHVNNTTIQITLDNFSTYLGLPAGSAVDLTLIACVNPNNAISGSYLDPSSNSHNFASDFSNSLFYITSYTPATDVLIYTIVTNGTPYFNNDFDQFTFGALGPLNYTVGYRSVLAFVKDIKVEVIDNYSRENIGNPGVEKKGILSTNLTGKSPFELTTTSGTGTNGASRGAFKSVLNDGENIAGFNRVGESMVYDTADFILQNVVSQYKDARFKITGVFDTIGQPINLRTKLIKDTDYLGARAFYIISGSYQDQEELLSFEMIEIEDTRESIDDLDNPLPT
jgi:hypothetical protein